MQKNRLEVQLGEIVAMRLRFRFRFGLRLQLRQGLRSELRFGLRSGLRLCLQERREGGLRLQRGLRLERRRRGRRDGDLGLDGAGVGSRIGELALRRALELNGVWTLELDGAGIGVLARTLRQVLALNRDLHLVLTGRLITVRRERDLGGGGVVRERPGGRNETVAHKGDARVRRRNALVDDA